MAAEYTKSSAVDQEKAVQQLDSQELGDVSGGAEWKSNSSADDLRADSSNLTYTVTESDAAQEKANTYGTYLDDMDVESCK